MFISRTIFTVTFTVQYCTDIYAYIPTTLLYIHLYLHALYLGPHLNILKCKTEGTKICIHISTMYPELNYLIYVFSKTPFMTIFFMLMCVYMYTLYFSCKNSLHTLYICLIHLNCHERGVRRTHMRKAKK